MNKTPRKTKVLAFLLAFTFVFFQIPITAQAARPADVKKAGSGNVLVYVPGSFERVSKTKILKRINEIRKEACTKHYINPSTGKKLKSSDYVAIKWSSNLEWIAQLRAAECTVYEEHTRPNGQLCFSASYKNETTWAENLAWNYSGLMQGIEQWYSEKKDWVKQNPYAVTGHYTSIINPEYRFIGLGSFIRSSGGWYGVSAEFSSFTNGSQTQSKLKGKTYQTMEVSKKRVTQKKLSAPSSIKRKKTQQLRVTCNVSYPGIMGGKNITKGAFFKGVTWKSSRPSVISVNGNGKITAKKAGKATITARVNGKSYKKVITVRK